MLKNFFVMTFLSSLILYFFRLFEFLWNIIYVQILIAIFSAIIIYSSLHFLLKSRLGLNPLFWYRLTVSALVIFIGMSFIILNVDRSRSFYLFRLVEINRIYNDSSSSKIKMIYDENSQPIFDEDYESRLYEQARLNNLKIVDNQIVMTRMGEIIFQTSELVAKIFKLNGFNFYYTLTRDN